MKRPKASYDASLNTESSEDERTAEPILWKEMEAATGFELLAAKDAWQAQPLHVNQDDMAAMRERVRDRDRDRGRHTARQRERERR